MNDRRIKELARLPKWQLAQMHKANGGLMPLATYQKWTKDELLRAVIEDEQLASRPVPIQLDGCTCGGIGDTGAHRRGCPWQMGA